MRRVNIAFIAALPVTLFASTSATAFQSSGLEACLERADAIYYQEMNRCYNYPFHDAAERDYCAYGAGLTHDGNRQACYYDYPEGVSFREEMLPLLSYEERRSV